MDIAGLSVVMNQSKVMEQASLSVMKLAMNSGKETAAAMTEMLEKAASPNLGNHIDTRV
ncbi:YjfB family protein [Clostridium sp. CX1]|uniref:YjfB family protein n=1 Tax=Clostridium sp. CX1 TaxID=2978346 RepID=UPI0021BFB1AE|nr:YjfB family protein [Clostridium sp. CX1]MCT8978516.1 YjfB family protein [Clostridium sp. CX1]